MLPKCADHLEWSRTDNLLTPAQSGVAVLSPSNTWTFFKLAKPLNFNCLMVLTSFWELELTTLNFSCQFIVFNRGEFLKKLGSFDPNKIWYYKKGHQPGQFLAIALFVHIISDMIAFKFINYGNSFKCQATVLYLPSHNQAGRISLLAYRRVCRCVAHK